MIEFLMANMHTDEEVDGLQDQIDELEKKINILANKLGVTFEDIEHE